MQAGTPQAPPPREAEEAPPKVSGPLLLALERLAGHHHQDSEAVSCKGHTESESRSEAWRRVDGHACSGLSAPILSGRHSSVPTETAICSTCQSTGRAAPPVPFDGPGGISEVAAANAALSLARVPPPELAPPDVAAKHLPCARETQALKC